MKKKFLVLSMTAGLVASMGLVGCSNNTANVESQGVTVATTAAVVENVETEAGETVSAEEVEVKVEESTEYETVAQVTVVAGTVTEISDIGVSVELEDGTPVVAMIGDETEVSEGLEVGNFVNITYDGMMTRSIPADLPNVISIDAIEDDGIGISESVDGVVVTETDVESTGEEVAVVTEYVTTTGTITEVNESDIHFVNEAGVEIVATISEDTEVYENMAVGDNISLDHADMMLMSEPGILPEVYRINHAD